MGGLTPNPRPDLGKDVARGEPDVLPIAIRAHAVRHQAAAAARHTAAGPRRSPADRPGAVLVFDTETTIDATQALLFGAWQYLRVSRDGTLSVAQEGLLYADDLPDRDPDGFATLQAYVADHNRRVQRHQRARRGHGPGRGRRLELLSRSQWVEQVFYRAAYQARARIVGFNLPFDLSRVAIAVAEGRGRNRGGFSFTLFAGNTAKGYAENRYRPRIQVKHVDAHRAFISFGSCLGADQAWVGDFFDLRTLAFALTGRGHSLHSACRAYGLPGKAAPAGHGKITPEYIDYCRQDVTATVELYRALVADLDLWPVDLLPASAGSPASLAKALLGALDVLPTLERQDMVSAQLAGYAMSAFYGGRAECRIRRVPLPVQLVDFTATYPTLFALLDLWRYVAAERLDTIDATTEVQHLLDTLTLDGGFDPALWPRLVGYALIQPDGDVLPVRARYHPDKPTFGIGINPLHTDQPLWYSLRDLVKATLLTGRPPTILRAFRLVPVGRLPGLTTVTLPGGQKVDATRDDPFRAMVEHRQRVRADHSLDSQVRDRIQLGLKIVSNAGAYGISAEYNRQDLPVGDTVPVDVYGSDEAPYTVRIAAPEDPGKYSCPPLAAVITGGARLLLALLERCVTDLGGTWVIADTDSMAIVATETGGLLPCPGGPYRTAQGKQAVLALSYAQVEAIRARFTALNPYDRSAVPGSILKHELDAHCYAIAAKRYALFRFDADGRPRLVPDADHQPCSHGLGHLLNPTDLDSDDRGWIRQLWEYELARVLGIPAAPPDWYHRPALARITITSPALWHALQKMNAGKPYTDQVKPFNFLLFAPGAQPPAAQPAAGHDAGHDAGVGRFRLIAPYETNPSRWLGLPWHDQHHPDHPVHVSTDPASAGTALLATYGDVAARYMTHPETKSLAPDGRPCQRHTRGLLQRRPVRAASIVHIGKEANRLHDRETGFLTADDLDDVQTIYTPARRPNAVQHLLPALRGIGVRNLAAETGLSERRLRDILTGTATPRPRTRQLLTEALTHARAQDATSSAEPATGPTPER